MVASGDFPEAGAGVEALDGDLFEGASVGVGGLGGWGLVELDGSTLTVFALVVFATSFAAEAGAGSPHWTAGTHATAVNIRT